MSTLPLIDPADATEPQARFLADVPPINLFKALAHAPAVAHAAARMGGVILYRTKLDPKVREMAILRAAHLAGSGYEVRHHERIGLDVGLTDRELVALRSGDNVTLPENAQLAVRWAEEVVRSGRASQELAQAAIEAYGAEQAVELAVTVGYYLMIGYFLESFRIPFEGAAFTQGVDINRPPEAAP